MENYSPRGVFFFGMEAGRRFLTHCDSPYSTVRKISLFKILCEMDVVGALKGVFRKGIFTLRIFKNT